MSERFDRLIVGAGLRGLHAALQHRRTHAQATRLVVAAEPWPGGTLRTHRTNGYVCELGAFAFTDSELQPLLALLERAPQPLTALAGAEQGLVFDGERRHPTALAATPRAFRTGNEELVQACRHALPSSFRLGRPITALQPSADGWHVTLGGEVPTELIAGELALALPMAVAGTLLGTIDPGLAAAAARMQHEARAFAFFGGDAQLAPELAGYGILPADELATPMAEAIFCSQVFAGRALPGRFLVRCEVRVEEGADDDAVLAMAAAELRRWTGVQAPFALQKLHRFTVEVPDGAFVETQRRLRDTAARIGSLHIA